MPLSLFSSSNSYNSHIPVVCVTNNITTPWFSQTSCYFKDLHLRIYVVVWLLKVLKECKILLAHSAEERVEQDLDLIDGVVDRNENSLRARINQNIWVTFWFRSLGVRPPQTNPLSFSWQTFICRYLNGIKPLNFASHYFYASQIIISCPIDWCAETAWICPLY